MAAFISKVQHKLISLITLRVSKATATRTKPNIAHPSQEGSADNNADEGAGENQPNGRENRSESVSRPSSHTLGSKCTGMTIDSYRFCLLLSSRIALGNSYRSINVSSYKCAAWETAGINVNRKTPKSFITVYLA